MLQCDVIYLAKQQALGHEVVENNYEELFNHYAETGLMPYAVAKGNQDPIQWMSRRLEIELERQIIEA